MGIFKQKHLDAILQGRKTQTRRTHKFEWKVGKTYGIRARWFAKSVGRILITRKFKQKLGDISLADIRKEGYSDIGEFKVAWEEIYGQGSWNPEVIVTVYEFVLQRAQSSEKIDGYC